MCSDILERCTYFVTEEIDMGAEQQAEFYLKSIMRSISSEPWVHQLPSDIKTFLERQVAVFYELNNGLLPTNIGELQIWTVYQFATEGYLMSLCGRGGDERGSHIGCELSMDYTLINCFSAKSGGLEDKCNKIPGYILTCGTVKQLKQLYEEMTPDRLAKSLLDLIGSYISGENFYNPYHIAIEEDDDDEKITISRTIRWLPCIMEYHHQPRQTTLFGVGLAHLLGEYGLLSLLPKLGFSIFQITPDGTFEPYLDPFNPEVVASKSLEASTVFTRVHNRLSFNMESRAPPVMLHQYLSHCAKPAIMDDPVDN